MKRILCFGDSNTWGWNAEDTSRFPEHIRWTGRLADALGSDYRVIEEGLSGRAAAFKDFIEPERCAIEHVMPILLSALPLDLIIIMLGTNDAKTHFHANSIDIGYGMEELLYKIQFLLQKYGSDAKILLVAPPSLGEDFDRSQMDDNSFRHIQGLPVIYETLAEQMSLYYLNAFELPLTLGCDGLHLNEEGQAAFARVIEQKVREILD